jgi:xanthine/uracil permease
MTTMAKANSELPPVSNTSKVFDIGIHGRLSPSQFLIIGLQNVFGMTGMFVFPGLLGRSFNLPLDQIAYLYGMTFLVCGVITILQSVWLLRLPIIQGPYAGSFMSPEVMNGMPLIMQLVLRQPVVSGGLAVIVLHALLSARPAAAHPSVQAGH